MCFFSLFSLLTEVLLHLALHCGELAVHLLLLLYFQAPDAAHLGELLFKCLLNFVSLSVEPFHFQDELVILPVIHHLLLHLALSHVQLVGEGELQLGWPFGRGGLGGFPRV